MIMVMPINNLTIVGKEPIPPIDLVTRYFEI